jgi:hypothetical protein
MQKSERAIQKEVMLALSQQGCLVWRSNTGQAWQGKTLHKTSTQVTLGDCRPVTFGLCKGGSDLIGVHSPSGRFLACEVKNAKGKVSDDQKKFLVAVNRAGGVAFVARSAQDAVEALNLLLEL